MAETEAECLECDKEERLVKGRFVTMSDELRGRVVRVTAELATLLMAEDEDEDEGMEEVAGCGPVFEVETGGTGGAE